MGTYITFDIKDIKKNERAVRSVGSMDEISNEFSCITVGLHQGSALSHCLFTLVMYKLTRELQDEILKHICSHMGLSMKLDRCKKTLERKDFRINRTMT